MKILTIQESKWDQGNGPASSLLTKQGTMCCLGFLGKACGATDNQLYGYGTPAATSSVKWDPALLSDSGNSLLCQDMITANDSYMITLVERKAKLRLLFKKIDIALRFVK